MATSLKSPRVSRQPAVKLRAATFADYEPMAALCRRYNIAVESREAWEHLWRCNPVYNQLKGDWPMGWVLEKPDGEIVGTLNSIPLAYELDGRRLLVSTSRAWVVDAVFRSYSPLLLDSYFGNKRADLFLHPTVNHEANAAHSAFGAVKVPAGQWDESTFWITGYLGFAATALHAKRQHSSNLLAVPLAAALFARDIFKQKPLRAGRQQLQSFSRFDQRFDAFWSELKSRNRTMLLAVRSSEVLQWHFEYTLRSGNAWVVAAVSDDRINAYAVFMRFDNPALGLKRVRLVDYQSLEGTTATLPALLRWALRRCRRAGVHMLENVGFRPCGSNLLEQLAPHRRKLPSWLFYYKSGNPALAARLKDAAVWNPSLFDGDASL